MDGKVIIQSASSLKEIEDQLGELGLEVGGRTGPQARTSQDCELYCLRRWLGWMSANGMLLWPITIRHQDQKGPDFIIEMGTEMFGLEHTEATVKEDGRESAEGEKQGGIHAFGDFGGRTLQSSQSLITAVIDDIQIALDQKNTKNYPKDQPNDLLIYPNSNPAFFVRASSQKEHMKSAVLNHPFQLGDFRHVYIFWDGDDISELAKTI